MKLFLVIGILNVIIFTILFLYSACKVASKADENFTIGKKEK